MDAKNPAFGGPGCSGISWEAEAVQTTTKERPPSGPQTLRGAVEASAGRHTIRIGAEAVLHP